ncbi:MAG: DNA-directed RNA polymerase subunit alpha, partial [Bacteroidota bacterium]
QRASDFHGIFEFCPLEKGYGVTIGNAMRRVLLASLEGFAITSVKINNVDQEFSTIKGVVEDVVNIILNLKQIRFKQITDENEENIFVSIGGKDKFTGADIGKASNNFEVVNSDMVICTMEPSVKLELELRVKRGRGYLGVEDNKLVDAPIGMIAMDAIYSPIKKVNFSVENYRVGQDTDFEKLIVHIETDGSIHPKDALKEAAKILIYHFMLFSDEKITIDSASMMNKGLEVIEARWLFNLQPEQIDVIIHPQSVIHSMVQFIDGSMKAQMGLPDMKLPILYALTYPQRVNSDLPRFNFADYPQLTFNAPDREVFRNLSLAFIALKQGGNMPCILNAANEIAVGAFLNDRIGFLFIPEVIEHCLNNVPFIKHPQYDDYVGSHLETQAKADEFIFHSRKY